MSEPPENGSSGPDGRSFIEADPDKDCSESGKVTPILTTAVVAAPILAVCCLGPVFYTSIAAWAAGWLGGIDPVIAFLLATIAGILAWALIRRRRTKRTARRGFDVEPRARETQPTNWNSR